MLEAMGLCKSFEDGSRRVNAVTDFSFSFGNHGLVAVVGESGSGKSSLLSLLSLLQKPDSGNIRVFGKDVSSLSKKDLFALRSRIFGYVFQEGNLLEDKTVIENLRLVCRDSRRTVEVLSSLGVLSLKNVLVSKLSGGEKQRVALTRCLLKEAKILIFDEPTAALDENNSSEVFKMISEVSLDRLSIVATHNELLAKQYAETIIRIKDGRVCDIENKGSNGSFQKGIKENTQADLPQKGMLDSFYGWKLLWRKKGRAINSLFVSLLALTLTFLQGSLSFFDSKAAFSKAIEAEGVWVSPIEETMRNAPTEEDRVIKAGNNLHSAAIETGLNSVPMVHGSHSLTNTDLYLLPYSEDLKIGGSVIEPPSKGQCVISTYLESLCKDGLDVAIYDGHTSLTKTFVFSNVIETTYDSVSWQSHLNDRNYQHLHTSEFLLRYTYVILNGEDFYSLFEEAPYLDLKASSFLLSNDALMRDYVSSTTRYYPYAGNEIMHGRAPEKEGEVVVSKGYMDSMGVSQDCLGETFWFRDLSSSPNYVNYLDVPNLYDTLGNVIVVGITDERNPCVYVGGETFKILADLLPFYSYRESAFVSSATDFAGELSKGRFTSTISFFSPIYQLISIKRGSFIYVIIGVELLVCLLAFAAVFSLGSGSISGKEREIALLLSIGYSPMDISKRYFLGSFLFQLIAFVSGVVLSFGAIIAINRILMAKDVFAISYSLLNPEFLSLLIGFAVVLLASFISSFAAIMRLGKIEISEIYHGKD